MASDRRTSSARSAGDGQRSTQAQLAIDVGVALAAVVLVISSIWAYAGVWPPMVVVESGSMMHGDGESALGVIDTGDLTLTKKVARDSDIITYLQGEKTGYRTYGSFGDVLIYSKNGHNEPGQVPIIHRAITRIVVNSTNPDCFDFPELSGPESLCRDSGTVNLGPVWTWDRSHPGGAQANLTIDLTRIVQSLGGYFHDGFITKGDHNDRIDQGNLPASPVVGHPGTPVVQPVLFEWVVGKAEGELPWFGAIKLYVGGGAGAVPGNSWRNLAIAIVAIAVGPLLVETLLKKAPATWKSKWFAATDKLPGGKKRARRRLELEERERGHERVRTRRKKRHGPGDTSR
jgi:signal peptidase